MKKIISIALLAFICLGLFGCSNTEEVKAELCGTWGYVQYTINGATYMFYEFSDDGTFNYVWDKETAFGETYEANGTYKIGDLEIVLTKNDGEILTRIAYTFEDDELELTDINSDRSGDDKMVKTN